MTGCRTGGQSSHKCLLHLRRFECRSDGTYLQVFYVGLEPTGDEPEDTEYTGPVRALDPDRDTGAHVFVL